MTTGTPSANHTWIIEVFDDLIAYAQKHGLNDLVTQIKVMKDVSKHEIQTKSEADPSPNAPERDFPKALFVSNKVH